MKRIVYLTALVCLLIVVVPHATSAATYTTSATATPSPVARGATATINVVAKSASAAKLLVDLEVYNASGQKIFQQAWDNQSFTAGQARTFSAAWAVPTSAATGAYTIKVGLFSPGWATLYNWNDTAGKLTVSTGTAPTATSAPTSAPTATPKPTSAATATPKPTSAATATPKPTSAATATPKPTSAPTVTPKPTSVPTAVPTVPSTGRYFALLPPGSTLPSDAECAAAIKSRPENKRMNATYNATRGNQKLAGDFLSGGDPRANTEIMSRVTGNFTGTTDEILQWAACKWGVDEDMVRAQAAIESWWQQTNKGDFTTNSANCAPGHGIGVDGTAGQCPESFGILQTRYPYEKSAWPSMINSTAFNADTTYGIWRACYEGYEGWLNSQDKGQNYAAGDAWGCVGRWYAGRWHTADAEGYISRVKGYLSQRIWETASFQEK